MKIKNVIIVVLISLICILSSFAQGSKSEKPDFPVLKGPYIGQKPPGMQPEIFAPGIISTSLGREFGITFSRDGKECFFTQSAQNNKLVTSREEKGTWTELSTPFFSGMYFDFEPLLTADGKKLIFGSMRPMPGKDESPLRQWEILKTNSGWADLKPVDTPFKERFVMYLTFASNGNAYFTGEDGICLSKYLNGKYAEPVKLGNNINYMKNSAHPYIAQDESYLVYDAQAEEGNPDLFISFKKPGGDWTKSVNMGTTLNTEKEEVCAFVSYDGKYLFFARITDTSGNIYWVDAKIIAALKPDHLK